MKHLLLLALALGLTSPAFSQARTPAKHPATRVSSLSPAQYSPAQQLFDDVNALLQNQYGGLSTVDRPALAREYQQRLDAVCAADAANCAVEKAFPVVAAEVTALGDDHTFFEEPDDYNDFVTSATGGDRLQFGVRLANLDGESRLVLDVIPGSASEQAGLRRGDVLMTINGQPYTYAGLRSAKTAGRQIVLGLTRAKQRLSVTLAPRASSSRDLPRLSFLPALPDPATQNQVAQNQAVPAGPVALIRIPTFLAGGSVAQTVHQEVAQAQAQKASGLIVDLRGNTGGDLSECDGAASAFVPTFTRLSRTAQGNARTVVQGGTRLDDGRLRGVADPALWTGPLTVMVDSSSASCSEFFAYELQYARRATIIGEATAGVGNTATRVFPLAGGAALQLAFLNYAKPDGTPYPVRVQPDIRATTDLTALADGQDTLLSAAVSALKAAPVLSAGGEAPGTSN